MPNAPVARYLILALSLITGEILAKPLEIGEEVPASCKLLGDVSANSGYGKNPNWKPIAKTYTENKAESLGATHLGPITYKAMGTFNGEAHAKAYACP